MLRQHLSSDFSRSAINRGQTRGQLRTHRVRKRENERAFTLSISESTRKAREKSASLLRSEGRLAGDVFRECN